VEEILLSHKFWAKTESVVLVFAISTSAFIKKIDFAQRTSSVLIQIEFFKIRIIFLNTLFE